MRKKTALPPCTLWVGGIPNGVDEDALTALFERSYGRVADMSMRTKPPPKPSWAFVTFKVASPESRTPNPLSPPTTARLLPRHDC